MANTQNLDLVKPLGTDHALVSVLNSNSDKIDAYAGAVNASLDGLRDGLGVLADGNTHAAITSGQFVYVKNHQTLPQGLYQATTNIAANGTLSTSNLTADPKGGLNTLSEQIGNIGGLIARNTTSGSTMSGTLDLTNAHAVIAVINVHSVGDISMIIPLDGTQSVYGHIRYNDNFWASVKLQLTASNGQYTISFDAKGSSVSTFDYAYFYRL